MRYHIGTTHDRRITPESKADIIIGRDGKAYPKNPTMIPMTIDVEMPGLRPTAGQLLTLWRLTRGYSGLTFVGDSNWLSEPLAALHILEKRLSEPQPPHPET